MDSEEDCVWEGVGDSLAVGSCEVLEDVVVVCEELCVSDSLVVLDGEVVSVGLLELDVEELLGGSGDGVVELEALVGAVVDVGPEDDEEDCGGE